jgi:hypothetical protein
MYRSNQNQDIIRLLLKLRIYEQEYPVRLFAMRRVSFLVLISEHVGSWFRARA